jgi:hypothetical protein
MTTIQKNSIITIVVILLLGGITVFAFQYNKNSVKDTDDQVMCTMEAKLCPDGSYVGRTGPACEFAECPGVSSTTDPLENIVPTTVTARLNEKISLFGAKATVTEVVEDSRCPANANCVWAGTVRVKVHATYGIFSKNTVLTLNEPLTYEGHSVTLVAVEPSIQIAGKATPPGDYAFTFSIK